MIVLVMDMAVNKLGKIMLFPLFVIFIITGSSCQKNNKKDISVENSVALQREKDSIHVTINVEFVNKGVFVLNSLVNQRNFNIEIASSEENIKKSKQLSLIKPTVFESYRFVKNKTVVKRYFVFKDDTISFKLCGSCINSYTGNAKNNILNTLIVDNNIYAVQTSNNLHSYISELKKDYEKKVQDVKSKSDIYNSIEQEAIQNYLTLYFYNKIFNVDFSQIKNSKIIEQLDSYYKEIFNNIKLLDKLNTVLNKSLVYNLLRYTSFKNKNPDLLENLQFFDSRLHQTEALDGFLLDYMEYPFDELSKKDISMIKKYIRKSSLANSVNIKTEKISENVFGSKLQNANSHDVTFKDAISVKTESLVLIDLWATWCIPCLNEMPAWNKAEQKYRGKIKFVKISIDNNFEKWHNFLLSKKDHNLNYIITNANHPFTKEFKVNTIPRYILLNKKYEVISDDFTRPSDPRFLSQIEKYLQ
ncbi:TlpA family protein disulfide reductase [Elizabethkingia meningoseptica]|uniref:TlpA family protein disulfide reductase n=1 Tax=Elizabethkingia meningoseptica TaxID=238 RepID=UPI000998FACD|nr:TlpA disulfide reductase family protein [Elizabethkingia meningoseptica]MEC4713030.1 TlpA disulfide reductase family protein [Elizabethkingia meningoseptica]OPB94914.1 alkyl hydroperoxide reductase [Elizabethkingia meningoseptica]